MKRGEGPKRKTELRNQTPLERKTPLPRPRLPLSGSGLSRKARQTAPRRPWRPTRKRVSREEREGRRLLAQRSGHVCEMGGSEAATEAHHRRNRSQGGTWSVTNLLHLCHKHHAYVTTHPQAAREQGWAVPSTRNPADVAVWVAGREYVLLDELGGMTPITEIPDEEAS